MAATQFTSTVATPGTPQRLTAGATPALPTLSGGLSGTITPSGRQIRVTANPGTTATKSLFIGGPSLSVSGNSGWSEKLAPGASVTLEAPGNDGACNAGDYFVDTDGTVAKYGVSVL